MYIRDNKIWDIEESEIVNGTVEIPNGVESIGGWVFFDTNIEHIVIPESVKEIGFSCFKNCKKLKSVKILNPDCKIWQGAFSGCSSLEYIELPDKLKVLESMVLNDCVRLESIELPKTLEIITRGVFSGCSSLQEVELPNSVRIVYVSAFNRCSSMVKLSCNKNIHTQEGNIIHSDLSEILKEVYNIRELVLYGEGTTKVVNVSGNIYSILEKVGYINKLKADVYRIELYDKVDTHKVYTQNYYAEYNGVKVTSKELYDIGDKLGKEVKKRFISNIE